MNRLESIARYKYPITTEQTNELFQFIYGPLSRRTSLNRIQSGLSTTYSYDTLNRITQINHEGIGTIQYPLYDKLGNRKEEINNSTPNHNFHFNYNYNTRYELETTLDQSQQTHFNYQYDLTGNRLTSNEEGNASTSTYTPNNLNQYSQVNNQTYQYDNNGNLTNDGSQTYTYDYENRLITAGNTNFKYDAFGRRLAKTTGSESALYVHDQDNILQTYNCNSSLQNCSLDQSFIYSNRIDEPLLYTRYASPDTRYDYYYHQDSLGNTIALTKTDGTLKETYQYDPYGKPHFFDSQGQSIPSSSVNNPYLFTGREWDSETNLYYYRARFYSPRTGRFLQRDGFNYVTEKILFKNYADKISGDFLIRDGIVKNPLRLHPYLYGRNNPLNLLDPFGFDSEDYQTAFEMTIRILAAEGMATTGFGFGLAAYETRMIPPLSYWLEFHAVFFEIWSYKMTKKALSIPLKPEDHNKEEDECVAK